MKWIHTIEKLQSRGQPVENDELLIIENIRTSFIEHDIFDQDSTSLAGQVSRHWASYYDDTWSWGITPRFGYMLRELATVCEQDLRR